jgi:hypothetical protein
MAVDDWGDAPQIHPANIRVGDTIFALSRAHLRFTVKMISAPQASSGRWTFFGRDDQGMQHTDTYREDELVRRYAKAS